MEVDQDNDGLPIAAEGGGPVSIEAKMYRASREGRPYRLQRLINDMRAGIRPEACNVYEEEEHDEDYYDEFEIDRLPGWTCLHIAAFYGKTECVRMLLREEIDGISSRAEDESTPLMVACAGPCADTAECIKLLGEPDQDFNLENEQFATALQIAIAWKPTLEIVHWLIHKGASMGTDSGWSMELMILLFTRMRGRFVQCPDDGEDESLEPDQQAEIAEIAIYLANRGYVRGALDAFMHCSESNIESPLLMERILDCFLENGAVLNDIEIVPNALKYRPLAVSLMAKKSILHLEGMSPMAILHGAPRPLSMEHEIYPFFTDVFNAITVMILQGKICGTVDQTVVNEIETILRKNMTPNLPDRFLPLETLHAMTTKVPSLQQLARTEVRRRLAEVGNFSRENIQRLEVDLNPVMIDYVQLHDLNGSEVDAIMAHMQYSPDVE